MTNHSHTRQNLISTLPVLSHVVEVLLGQGSDDTAKTIISSRREKLHKHAKSM